MKELKIKLDVFNGPVWKEYYDIDTDTSCTRIDIVDNDEKLRILDDKAQRLLVSFYHLSADNPSDIFNYTLARASKNELLNLIVQIKQRLSVINDGSFKVVDEETSVIEKW